MDKASKPTENQNRGAVATGWVLKFFQRLSIVASILLLESLAGRHRSRF